jgi:hypothetical protein
MALSYAFNPEYYNTTTSVVGKPIVDYQKQVPVEPRQGTQFIPFSYVIPTTQLDDVGDVAYLIPYHAGAEECGVLFNCGDGDTGGTTLDMDFVRRTLDTSGTATDTILGNMGTAFSAAQTGKYVSFTPSTVAPHSRDEKVHLVLKVNAAATTPAEVTIEGLFFYR